jgi:cytoskeletal protein RodZ
MRAVEAVRTGIACTVTVAILACPLLVTAWWWIIRQVRTHQANTLETLERDAHDGITQWPVSQKEWS